MNKLGKVVVLVLEGVSNQILKSWSEKGYLPVLGKLLKNQGGHLESLVVPYEASALQTAFTGYKPGDHGIFSYWKVHNPGYIPQVWCSNELRKKYLWQREELKERKFGVINIFGTHPPYSINGSMLTYLFNQSLHACYPKNLLRKLASEGLGYGQDVSMFYNGQPRDEFLNGLLQVEDCRVKVALKILEDTDILISNFTLIDRVSHFYWQEIEDGSPMEFKDTALFKAYQRIDSAVGEFTKILDKQSNLLVFSDIGFGPLREFISINELLRKGGFLARTEDNRVDWKNTRAFETVQGSHGVDIHQKGIYSDGIINQDDYDKVRFEVASYLKEVINPKTGLKYFKDVVPREQLYHGENFMEAPDLILLPADERYSPVGDDYWAQRVHREYQSGWHRSECFWTGTGPDIDNIKRDGTISDIAPTIFQLCHKDIPEDFSGQSLIR